MYKLSINGEQVELNSKTKIQLNKMLIDIEDLSKRGLKFTNSFTLPFTSKNDRLTGYPSRLASDSKAFETTQTYTLSGASGVVSVGDVVVKSFNDKKGIKIQLAEGFNFWSQAGKRLLNDLVLHDFDFVFTTANMDARKTKASDIFVTALHSATGNNTDTALVNYKYTRPCYYWRRVLDFIISELGYTVDYGDIFDLTDLNELGSLSNAEKFFVSDFKYRFQDFAAFGVIDISTGSSVFTKTGNVSLSGSTLTNNLYKTSYVIKGTVTSSISTSLSINTGTGTEKILIPKGTSFVNFRTDELDISSSITFESPLPVTFDDVYIYSAINENDIFEVTGNIDVTDYLVLADYNLPKQTCKEFIKTIFKVNFLNTDIDENKKEIKFTYLGNQISANNVTDLSRNVERYFTVKSNSTYAQLNVMSYNNDDEINKDLGSAFFTIENENAKESKDWLTINDYSASNELTAGSETVITANIYNVADQKRKSVRDRIVYLNETGAFGINAVFNLVSFQRIYSSKYFNFIQATKRERVILLTAYINETQFNALQRSPVANIDFLESNFLITNITKFNDTKKCLLEAVKFN